MPTDPILDVRGEPHARRHELIFSSFGELTPGNGFVLVNDHDPKPLYYQFNAQYKERFSWDYIEQGPEVWRVRIGRASAVSTPQPAGAPAEPIIDTRAPDADSCMNLTNHAVDALTPGASFVLVADHDPIGLCYMLDAERPGVVTWQPLEEGPATWQVRITKVRA